jgi:hypothetical protein
VPSEATNAFLLARVLLERAGKRGITEERVEQIRRAYDSRRDTITLGDQHRQGLFILSVLLALLLPNDNRGDDEAMKTNPHLPKELLDAINKLPGGKRITEGIREKIGAYDGQIKRAIDAEVGRGKAIAVALNSILDCFYPPLKPKEKEAALEAIEKWAEGENTLESVERLTQSNGSGGYQVILDREECLALVAGLESDTGLPAHRWPPIILRLMRATDRNLIELYARSAHRLSVLMKVQPEEAVGTLLAARENPLPIFGLILEKIDNPGKPRLHDKPHKRENRK